MKLEEVDDGFGDENHRFALRILCGRERQQSEVCALHPASKNTVLGKLDELEEYYDTVVSEYRGNKKFWKLEDGPPWPVPTRKYADPKEVHDHYKNILASLPSYPESNPCQIEIPEEIETNSKSVYPHSEPLFQACFEFSVYIGDHYHVLDNPDNLNANFTISDHVIEYLTAGRDSNGVALNTYPESDFAMFFSCQSDILENYFYAKENPDIFDLWLERLDKLKQLIPKVHEDVGHQIILLSLHLDREEAKEMVFLAIESGAYSIDKIIDIGDVTFGIHDQWGQLISQIDPRKKMAICKDQEEYCERLINEIRARL